MFLVLLAIVLFFILGVRYGQNIEKANKVISFVLSITPTQKPTPVPIAFVEYKHATCGAQFLYPNTLAKENETSTSARFVDGKQLALAFDCKKGSNIFSALATPQTATEEVPNPRNGKTIYFVVEKSLLPLLQKSLELVP